MGHCVCNVCHGINRFDGCEFYFARHSELDGCTFREASLRLQGAVLVGVKRGGDIMLNPDSALPSAVTSRHHHLSSGVLRKKFRIEPGDEVIVCHPSFLPSFLPPSLHFFPSSTHMSPFVHCR